MENFTPLKPCFTYNCNTMSFLSYKGGSCDNWNEGVKSFALKDFHSYHTKLISQHGEQAYHFYQLIYGVNRDYIDELLSGIFRQWRVLFNVTESTTLEDIKSAYKDLMRQYHPDVNHAPNALNISQLINEAKEAAFEHFTPVHGRYKV